MFRFAAFLFVAIIATTVSTPLLSPHYSPWPRPAFILVDHLYDSQQPSLAGVGFAGALLGAGDGDEDCAFMVSVVVLVATMMMIVREKAKVSSNLISNLRLTIKKLMSSGENQRIHDNYFF